MKKLMLIFLTISIVLLTGCWDQKLLKDARLVYGSAFDLAEDGRIHTTAAIRTLQRIGPSGGGKPVNELVTAEGDTVRETRMKMDEKVSGTFSAEKNRIFLLGEDLAKQDIYSVFDILYRTPESNLSASVGIVNGKASDILKMSKKGETLISEYTYELIESAVQHTTVPHENIQSICTLMFDPGRDFVLPLLDKRDNEVAVDGVGLIHGRKYTGHKLSNEQAGLFLLLDDNYGKTARFVKKVNKGQKPDINNYVTVNVMNSKRKLDVQAKGRNVKVSIGLQLNLTVNEYPLDTLAKKTTIKDLDKKLSEKFTNEAKEVVSKLQEANCDALGIGRNLIAFHNETWKQLDWEKDYPTITIIPKIHVNILGSGIIQ
ncbi:Ger(x)C family spore germination protein [Pseudalkalibacillus caeni]|uniref:Ger(X)C family spore germination protein n=1 Tax=Exobacillus caeni TaxID=2574798 RepID=A0A5R9F428_9BACL|nr:Ger(x)C family spore germination protein [Pseudalkalibacillus caeni]TLS35224.1 Ger(x)C family spore germination protein [Pseudalkalibacillus caeni]